MSNRDQAGGAAAEAVGMHGHRAVPVRAPIKPQASSTAVTRGENGSRHHAKSISVIKF